MYILEKEEIVRAWVSSIGMPCIVSIAFGEHGNDDPLVYVNACMPSGHWAERELRTDGKEQDLHEDERTAESYESQMALTLAFDWAAEIVPDSQGRCAVEAIRSLNKGRRQYLQKLDKYFNRRKTDRHKECFGAIPKENAWMYTTLGVTPEQIENPFLFRKLFRGAEELGLQAMLMETPKYLT